MLTLLATLPFLHIGISYYASLQTVMVFLLLIYSMQSFAKLKLSTWIFSALIGAAMIAGLLASAETTTDDVLRRGRETLFFIIIAFATRSFAMRPPFSIGPNSYRPIAVLGVIFAVLAFIQYLSLGRGKYFGLPQNWFIANQDTLPSALSLFYSKLRPAGTYGEPSYFAFVLLSMFVMFVPLLRERFRRPFTDQTHRFGTIDVRYTVPSQAIWACTPIVVAGALTQSLAFYLALPALVYVGVIRNMSFIARTRTLLIAGLVGVAVINSPVVSTVTNRIANTETDTSTSARIFTPLLVTPQYLMAEPAGAPQSRLVEAIHPFSSRYGATPDEILNNGFFNMIFFYGFTGLFCTAWLVSALKDLTLTTYLLLCMMFNGAIFAADKAAAIMLTVGIYYSMQQWIENNRRARQIDDNTVQQTYGVAHG